MHRCTIIAACIATLFVSACATARQSGKQPDAIDQAARALEPAAIEDDADRPTGTRLLHIGEQAFSRADIQRVALNFDEGGFAVLDIEMTQEAATRLHTETVRLLNTDIALRIDDDVLSTARLVEPLADGRLRISGGFSVAEIEAMAKSAACGLGLSSSQYVAPRHRLRC